MAFVYPVIWKQKQKGARVNEGTCQTNVYDKGIDEKKISRYYAFLRNVSCHLTCKFNSNFLGQIKWNENGKKAKTKGK